MSKPSDPPKPAALASHDTKGHRAPMRQKLLEKGGTALTDLEILEMHQRYKELALSLGVVTQLGSGLAGKLAGLAAGAQ